MKAWKKKRLDRLDSRGEEIKRHSFLRWYLFDSYHYKRDGTTRHKGSFQRFRLQTLFYALSQFSLVITFTCILFLYLDWEIAMNTDPGLENVKRIQGVIKDSVHGRRWDGVIIDTNEGVFRLWESRPDDYMKFRGKEIEVFYTDIPILPNHQYQWKVKILDGPEILSYERAKEIAESTRDNITIILSIAIVSLIIFCASPLLNIRSR